MSGAKKFKLGKNIRVRQKKNRVRENEFESGTKSQLEGKKLSKKIRVEQKHSRQAKIFESGKKFQSGKRIGVREKKFESRKKI